MHTDSRAGGGRQVTQDLHGSAGIGVVVSTTCFEENKSRALANLIDSMVSARQGSNNGVLDAGLKLTWSYIVQQGRVAFESATCTRRGDPGRRRSWLFSCVQ